MSSEPKYFSVVTFLARAGLCLAFVYSGITKTFDFQSAIDEQLHFGLHPPELFAAITIATQLGSSALILFLKGRVAAFGAIALAVFTLMATFIGHQFWNETGMDRFREINSFLEHMGLVGGFILIALSEFTNSSRNRDRHSSK